MLKYHTELCYVRNSFHQITVIIYFLYLILCYIQGSLFSVSTALYVVTLQTRSSFLWITIQLYVKTSWILLQKIHRNSNLSCNTIINVLKIWKVIQYLHIQFYYKNRFLIIWYFNILPVWLNYGILEIQVRASFSENKASEHILYSYNKTNEMH